MDREQQKSLIKLALALALGWVAFHGARYTHCKQDCPDLQSCLKLATPAQSFMLRSTEGRSSYKATCENIYTLCKDDCAAQYLPWESEAEEP